MKIIPLKFFQRPTLLVARDLLGKFLMREKTGESENGDDSGQKLIAMITEVEVYDGPEDLASHARLSRRTGRTEVMFASGGVWYTYFTYGMHWLLNIVTGPADYPAAVLIRSVQIVEHRMFNNLNGPARLTKYFGIDKTFNGQPAVPETGLYIIDKGIKIPPAQIKTTPRIGVAYAGPIWSRKPYRFLLQPSGAK